METLHFGLHIAKNDKFDALQDIAARLFICPRISPEHATSLEELKFINSELAVKAFIDTLVEILGYDKQMDNDYADILRGDQLILKEEFHALYNIDQPNASAEDIAFVDSLYARIKECDLQTFPYKF